MTPLHLLVHAADRDRAARIEQALRRGDPGCVLRIVDSTAGLSAQPEQNGVDGIVSATIAPTIAPTLRHELNNHLALVRMLAEVMTEAPDLPEKYRAKIREMGSAAEAAALALRRTKTPD